MDLRLECWKGVGVMFIFIGILCLLLAAYEVYSVRKWFIYVKTEGNKNTSPFILWAMWSAIVFSFFLFAADMIFIFNLFGIW